MTNKSPRTRLERNRTAKHLQVRCELVPARVISGDACASKACTVLIRSYLERVLYPTLEPVGFHIAWSPASIQRQLVVYSPVHAQQ